MRRRIEPFECLVLGAGIVAIIGVGLAQLNAAYPNFVYNYQGLIGAIIALGAAIGAYFSAILRIRESRRQAQEDRQHDHIRENRGIAQGFATLRHDLNVERTKLYVLKEACNSWVGGDCGPINEVISSDIEFQAISLSPAIYLASHPTILACQAIATLSIGSSATADQIRDYITENTSAPIPDRTSAIAENRALLARSEIRYAIFSRLAFKNEELFRNSKTPQNAGEKLTKIDLMSIAKHYDSDFETVLDISRELGDASIVYSEDEGDFQRSAGTP